MSVFTKMLPDNPVLTKELRVRMRGTKAYWILFGYLGILTLFVVIQYAAWQANVSSFGQSSVSRLGGEIYNWMSIIQAFLVLFITPAITSGSITIENEQRTMDMLTMTRLTRRSIIAGKLLSGVLFTSLLMFASLPLVSICFMMGSVDPEMVFSHFLMMLFGSALVGAIGLMWSSLSKTTTQAVMLTYGTVFALLFGGIFPFGFYMSPNFTGGVMENLFHTLGVVWFGNQFYISWGLSGVGFAVFCAMTGWLCSIVAMSRLETYPERRAGWLRGVTALLVGSQLLALNLVWLNSWYSRGAQVIGAGVQPPIAILIMSVFVLFLAVPVFATGELDRDEARNFGKDFLKGFTPSGLKQGKLATGLPFLTLFTLFLLVIYAASFVFVGKGKDIAHSGAGIGKVNPVIQQANGVPGSMTTTNVNGVSTVTSTTIINGKTVTTTMVNGAVTSTTVNGNTFTPANAPKPRSVNPGDFGQIALVFLVFSLGLGAFCSAISLLFRSRWVACVLAVVLMIAVIIVPEISKSPTYSGGEAGAGVNLYYFNPMQPIFQMADPSTYWHNSLMESGALYLGLRPMWQGTLMVWGTIGLLSLLLLVFLVARTARTASMEKAS